MSTNARKRLVRDLKKLRSEPPHGVIATPQDSNVLCWYATIIGPEDTPWEAGLFKLQLEFSEEYPTKPPKVIFLSKVFHPNVYENGQICLDILQNQWSQLMDVAAILTSIQSLLPDPNPTSPANSEAAKLFVQNRREYERRVKEVVQLTWAAEEASWT